MIVLYIWARDLNEAAEDVKHGFGNKNLNKVRILPHRPENDKLFEVTINAKEIE